MKKIFDENSYDGITYTLRNPEPDPNADFPDLFKMIITINGDKGALNLKERFDKAKTLILNNEGKILEETNTKLEAVIYTTIMDELWEILHPDYYIPQD